MDRYDAEVGTGQDEGASMEESISICSKSEIDL